MTMNFVENNIMPVTSQLASICFKVHALAGGAG